MDDTVTDQVAEGYRVCAPASPARTARRTTGARSCSRPSVVDTSTPSTPCAAWPTTSSMPGRPAAAGGRDDRAAATLRRALPRGAAGAPTQDPVIAAVGHSVRTCGIADECFDRFFGAMAQDLTQTTYETWDDLLGYMDGSAAVIGEMMLPVLRPLPDALGPARAPGVGLYLTNFLRDVGEDLDRGRVYVPQEDLRHFGADPMRGGSRPSGASHALRDRAQPRPLRRGRPRHTPASALVGAVRVRCTHALRPHPRAHRGS